MSILDDTWHVAGGHMCKQKYRTELILFIRMDSQNYETEQLVFRETWVYKLLICCQRYICTCASMEI